jgi:hypothetical protein
MIARATMYCNCNNWSCVKSKRRILFKCRTTHLTSEDDAAEVAGRRKSAWLLV